MGRYFFDFRDGQEVIADEEGVELSGLQAVQREAARALAGLTRDTVASFEGADLQQMSIIARDESGPVLEVEFSFKVIHKQ